MSATDQSRFIRPFNRINTTCFSGIGNYISRTVHTAPLPCRFAHAVCARLIRLACSCESDWLLGGHLQPFDGNPFEQRSESAIGLRPGQFDGTSTRLAAVGPRRFGMQDGLELAGVQMSPLTLRPMVIERAKRAAFRARPVQACRFSRYTWTSPAASFRSTRCTLQGPADAQDGGGAQIPAKMPDEP